MIIVILALSLPPSTKFPPSSVPFTIARFVDGVLADEFIIAE